MYYNWEWFIWSTSSIQLLKTAFSTLKTMAKLEYRILYSTLVIGSLKSMRVKKLKFFRLTFWDFSNKLIVISMIVFLDIKTFDISLNSTQLFGSGLESQTSSSFTASNWRKKIESYQLENDSTGNNNNNYNLINKINSELLFFYASNCIEYKSYTNRNKNNQLKIQRLCGKT